VDLENLARPKPPDEIMEVTGSNLFLPAPALMSWIDWAYLDEDGPLFTEDHDHLPVGEIACLWTNAEYMSKGRQIVGQADKPGAGQSWSSALATYQLQSWFGYDPPFLITLDALACAGMDNAAFCALVDHELYHCAQATDREGQPSFNQSTGRPNYCIKGHDVEEFVGVVRRFGIHAAGESATDLVIAAAQTPLIAPAELSRSCGTCLRLVA
jgi:hypothetical protein